MRRPAPLGGSGKLSVGRRRRTELVKRNGSLRDMRKRRVGVTARSRLVVENQAIGTPQTASEMAAPLVSRTPMGTVATAKNECGWKHGGYFWREKQSGSEPFGQNGKDRPIRGAARYRAHEALPHTPPGGEPPETPGPFPCTSIIGKGGNLSRVRFAGQNQAALDSFPPFRRNTFQRSGKGASGNDLSRASPWSAGQASQSFRPTVQGIFSIDRGRPSHGSRDRKGAVPFAHMGNQEPSFHKICRSMPIRTGASRPAISRRLTSLRTFSSVEPSVTGLVYPLLRRISSSITVICSVSPAAARAMVRGGLAAAALGSRASS